jgi:type IV pilus assembly protein PilV
MITTPTRERGFTLIEVLVSLLVLSIGLFGMLAVIITSLKMNSSSVYRTIASQQAYAMAETLRANPTTVGTTNTAAAIAFSTPGVTPAFTATCLQAAGCSQGTTTTNGFVQMSLKMWQDQLAALLPQGQGITCQDNASPPAAPTSNAGVINWNCSGPTIPPAQPAPYVVKVCWNESRIAASSSVTGTGGTTESGGMLCTYTNL